MKKGGNKKCIAAAARGKASWQPFFFPAAPGAAADAAPSRPSPLSQCILPLLLPFFHFYHTLSGAVRAAL